MRVSLILATGLLLVMTSGAQMDSHGAKPAAKASTEVVVTGLGGTSKGLTAESFRALPHATAKVHNAHSGKDESYSGVPVRDLLAMVAPAVTGGPKVSTNMQVVVAGATDNFQVVLTLCDIDPDCRSGEAVVADRQDGEPLI